MVVEGSRTDQEMMTVPMFDVWRSDSTIYSGRFVSGNSKIWI